MIRQLGDTANAITITGLTLSVIGIHVAMSGQPLLAIAIVLWALLADHLDGIVAARTRHRAPETGKIGKSLDSFADLVSDAVFPAVVLLQVGDGSFIAVVTSIVLVLSCALRFSYFNVFGLSGGCFIGLPASYVLPLMAVLFLLEPLVPEGLFPTLLAAALLVISVLHVTPIRVPRPNTAMYAVVTFFAVMSSVLLATRALG